MNAVLHLEGKIDLDRVRHLKLGCSVHLDLVTTVVQRQRGQITKLWAKNIENNGEKKKQTGRTKRGRSKGVSYTQRGGPTKRKMKNTGVGETLKKKKKVRGGRDRNREKGLKDRGNNVRRNTSHRKKRGCDVE